MKKGKEWIGFRNQIEIFTYESYDDLELTSNRE
jgi:hypothetical protein